MANDYIRQKISELVPLCYKVEHASNAIGLAVQAHAPEGVEPKDVTRMSDGELSTYQRRESRLWSDCGASAEFYALLAETLTELQAVDYKRMISECGRLSDAYAKVAQAHESENSAAGAEQGRRAERKRRKMGADVAEELEALRQRIAELEGGR